MTSRSAEAPAEVAARSPYRDLERRTMVSTVAVLLALASVSWWWTVVTARGMSGMVQGLTSAGVAMPFGMAAPVFLGMWAVMMVAMMFPATAPIVLMHRMVVRRRGEGALPTVAFVTGYLAIWVALGALPLAALIGFRNLADHSVWVDRTAGAVLVLAGAYQFTPWKDACLRACRTPLGFLMTHDFGRGPAGALRTGLSHGLYCAGCCWALMAVLFTVGLMNLAWMAVIAGVFIVEKNWRHGVAVTRAAGVAVLALGLAVLADPGLLGAVAPVAHASMTM